jgi:hypothetical protein
LYCNGFLVPLIAHANERKDVSGIKKKCATIQDCLFLCFVVSVSVVTSGEVGSLKVNLDVAK